MQFRSYLHQLEASASSKHSHSVAGITIVDGHAKAANGENDSAGCAEEVELAQAGDVGELGDDELDGAKNGDPGLQGDPAGLQLLAGRPGALGVVQSVYPLQEASTLQALLAPALGAQGSQVWHSGMPSPSSLAAEEAMQQQNLMTTYIEISEIIKECMSEGGGSPSWPARPQSGW